jgi:hypothetical protein
MQYKKSDFGKPLEECSREQDEHGVSEYITMIAISRMQDEFTEDELKKEVAEVILNDTLRSLVEKGLLKVTWDAEQKDFIYDLA